MTLIDLDGVLPRLETHGKIHLQKTFWRSSQQEGKDLFVRENEYMRMCISWRILDVFIGPFENWIHVIKQVM